MYLPNQGRATFKVLYSAKGELLPRRYNGLLGSAIAKSKLAAVTVLKVHSNVGSVKVVDRIALVNLGNGWVPTRAVVEIHDQIGELLWNQRAFNTGSEAKQRRAKVLKVFDLIQLMHRSSLVRLNCSPFVAIGICSVIHLFEEDDERWRNLSFCMQIKLQLKSKLCWPIVRDKTSKALAATNEISSNSDWSNTYEYLESHRALSLHVVR